MCPPLQHQARLWPQDNDHRWTVPGERTREVTLNPGALRTLRSETRARPEPARPEKRAISYIEQRSTTDTDEHQSPQLSDDCAPRTFQAGHRGPMDGGQAHTNPPVRAWLRARSQGRPDLPGTEAGCAARQSGFTMTADRHVIAVSGPKYGPASSRPREAGDANGTCTDAARSHRAAPRRDRY